MVLHHRLLYTHDFFSDFSILYDDGVVKKQAGSTRLTMVAIIKSRQTCAWCIQLGTRRCDPNLQDAVRTEPLKTQSDEFGLKEGKMPVCDGNWYLAARKYDYVAIIFGCTFFLIISTKW